MGWKIGCEVFSGKVNRLDLRDKLDAWMPAAIVVCKFKFCELTRIFELLIIYLHQFEEILERHLLPGYLDLDLRPVIDEMLRWCDVAWSIELHSLECHYLPITLQSYLVRCLCVWNDQRSPVSTVTDPDRAITCQQLYRHCWKVHCRKGLIEGFEWSSKQHESYLQISLIGSSCGPRVEFHSNIKHILTQRSCIYMSTNFQKVTLSTCGKKHRSVQLGNLIKLRPW